MQQAMVRLQQENAYLRNHVAMLQKGPMTSFEEVQRQSANLDQYKADVLRKITPGEQQSNFD